jgi:BirA family biotin operon repressor/biotin-[acetyl-CoA-carboxylase] ligase
LRHWAAANRLRNEVDLFDRRRFEQLADRCQLALGRPLTAVSVTGSTSDDAMAAARAGAPHGAVFVADEQTHGRGRRGRRWISSPDASLLFSVVLRPQLAAEQARPVTLAFGLATRDVLAARVPVDVALKWPNDVVVGDRKLAGVLVESQLRGRQLGAVVVGIGANLKLRQMPAQLRGRATSIVLLGGGEPDREQLLVELLAAIDARLAQYLEGGLRPLLGELNRHDGLRGSRLRVAGRCGVASGIDQDGALLVRDPAGIQHRVTSGTVHRLL